MDPLSIPLISVLIPTHNRSILLQEALASVVAQEGVGELFEMEIIVIDDCSSDDTSEVMKGYPKAQYIRLERNQGQSAALNIGIFASKGEFIALLDDDDFWLPNRIKMHLHAFEEHPEVGVVYGQAIATGDGPDTIWPSSERAPSGNAFKAILLEEFVLTDCVIIRREAFEKAGYFDIKLLTMNHYDMFLRLAFQVPFAFVPGAIAVARFSKSAKWFTNIVSGGYVKTTLYIVERALSHVSDENERIELRRLAYISWHSQFNYWLHKAGQVDQIRNRLLSTLTAEPWMMTYSNALSVIRSSIVIVSLSIAITSDSPISDIRIFFMEVRKAIALTTGFKSSLHMHQLLATVWLEVGIALTNEDTPVKRRKAGYAAFFSIVNNPGILKRKELLRIALRIFISGINYDKLVSIIKRIR